MGREPGRHEYHNYRAKSPLADTYSVYNPVPIECLTEQSGYAHAPLLEIATDGRSNCTMSFPSKSSVWEGNFNVSATNCKVVALTFDCVFNRYPTKDNVSACAAFVTDERGRWVFTHANGPTGITSDNSGPAFSVPTNNETLAVFSRYIAHDPDISTLDLQLAAAFQAQSNSSVNAIRDEILVTEISRWLFWPSVGIISAVLLSCCCLGLVSILVMMRTGCRGLDLGFSLEQVARLAATEVTSKEDRSSWYLKLHPTLPCITVSKDCSTRGDWAEEDIANRFRTRD